MYTAPLSKSKHQNHHFSNKKTRKGTLPMTTRTVEMRRQERPREILYSRISVGFSTGFLMKSLSNSSTRPTSTWRDSTPQPPEVTTGTPPRPTWEEQPTPQPRRQRPQQPRQPAQPIIHLQPPGRVTITPSLKFPEFSTSISYPLA